MMVFFVTVIQGIGTNAQSQQYHTNLKGKIFDNIDAKQWKAAQEKW